MLPPLQIYSLTSGSAQKPPETAVQFAPAPMSSQPGAGTLGHMLQPGSVVVEVEVSMKSVIFVMVEVMVEAVRVEELMVIVVLLVEDLVFVVVTDVVMVEVVSVSV